MVTQFSGLQLTTCVMNKKIIYFVLTVLIVSNLPVFTHYIAYKVDNNYYQLSNYNGSFTAIITFGFKDGGWSGIYTGFDGFISETNPPSRSRIMYRIYRINPLCFWRWYHYFMMSRHFPYMDWEEIKNRRGYDKMPREQLNNRWQNF